MQSDQYHFLCFGKSLKSSHQTFFGRLMLDLVGATVSPSERALLSNPQVGGVILFARNIRSRQQVSQLVEEIRSCSLNIIIAVDQEGGRVQRLVDGYTKLPPMQVLGDLVSKSLKEGTELSHEIGWLMASEVLASGLDLSFAPVLDVDRNTSSIIADRSFSDKPDVVIQAARAFVDGMAEAGMASTGKHFPGHGGIFADSHLEAPTDRRTLEELSLRDLRPFSALSKRLDAVMPAHITYPEVDEHSVGFSPFWLKQILRKDLNFTGIIFSDDLSMKGADVAGGYAHKAQLALEAGCDMILVCNCPEGAIEVLSFMEQQHLSLSEELSCMRPTKIVEWNSLEKSTRRASIIKKLSLW